MEDPVVAENEPKGVEDAPPGDNTAEDEPHEGKQVEFEEEHVDGEHKEGEPGESEGKEDAQLENDKIEGEHIEGEHIEGEHIEGEHIEGEQIEGEHVEGEHKEGDEAGEDKDKVVEGEEAGDEVPDLENIEGEQEEQTEPPVEEPPVEEEEQYVEEPPPDPTAPYDFSDSKEALKPFYELRPDQLAEVEQLWAIFQDHTPAYSDLDNFITEKELVYMLKSLLLLPVTPEQLQELIVFCVRPLHPKGHIDFDQFVKMVTMRQRDFNVEEELRCALKVFDRDNSGEISREELKEALLKQGHCMPPKILDKLIKEVDMSNDGTLGVEDIVGTMCIDLNPEDLILLRNAVYPNQAPPPSEPEEEI